MTYKGDRAVLHSYNENQEKFIDYTDKAIFNTLNIGDESFTTRRDFDSLIQVNFEEDTAKILGHVVHKANMSLFSNNIDIWYTKDLSLKGTPDPKLAPYLGTVLKIIRNGNYEITAVDIKKGAIPDSLNTNPIPGKLVSEAKLRALQIKNRYKTIPVFSNEQINFGDSIVNPKGRKSNKIYRFSEGTVIAKRIKLPENFEGNIFATLTQSSMGDAYDRTGGVFVIPVKDSISFLDALENGIEQLPKFKGNDKEEYQGYVTTKEYQPPIELMRFFTPFGVGAFNTQREIEGYKWADSVTYKQDITDLAPVLEGETWIGVYIGNYDENGHKVSLDLNYYPGQASNKNKDESFAMPLFNTLNLMEMAGQNYAHLFRKDSLEFEAFIPEKISDLQLRYISTGHGGWGGGDEFNQKVNTIAVDGKEVYSYMPWRTDCASYRLRNPSSGNFENGLSSSDLSRSRWCPGTTTNPIFIPLPNLEPGWHKFTISIPQGEPEGSSFSYWNVSGILVGKKQ